MELVCDFETRSPCDIKKCGAYKYAEQPDTDVTMLAVLDVETKNCRVWIGPSFRHLCPTEIEDSELGSLIKECSRFIAHNAPFERAIWKNIMVDRYGFCELPIEKVYDTAPVCSMCGLPRNLEKAVACWDKSLEQKDMEGSKIMKKFMKPRKPVKAQRMLLCPDNPDSISEQYDDTMKYLSVGNVPPYSYWHLLSWHEDKDDFIRMVEYCRRDVYAELALYNTLPRLSKRELEFFALDQRINDRGVKIDLKSAAGIIKLVESYTEELKQEALDITLGEVKTMRSIPQIKAWLSSKDIEVTSVDKAAVKELLALPNLDPLVRRFLEIRSLLGKSAVAKYDAMFNTVCRDGRVRGLHVFSGAQTMRWSGQLLQTQNLPRPSEEVDEDSIALAATGDADFVMDYFPDLSVLASDCIRGMFIAPEDKELICSDFSAIEGRGLAYLAGEKSVLDAYRSGLDIYKVNAAAIYDIPYEQVDGGGKGPQRQDGKVAELACGYSGGYGALCRFGFDKKPISDHDCNEALNNCAGFMSKDSLEEFVRFSLGYHQVDYREDYTEDDKKVFLAEIIRGEWKDGKNMDSIRDYLREVKGRVIVKKWRDSHPMTVKFWYGLRRMVTDAMKNPGEVYSYRGIKAMRKSRFLRMKLPSGRFLYYLDPKLERRETPWSTPEEPRFQEVVTAMTIDAVTKQFVRRPLNISILVENVTQAFCRDLLAEAMLRLDKEGYPVIMHIHDEAVAEIPKYFGSVKEFENIMSINPVWAEGMPIKAAGGYIGKRYRK